MEKAGAVAFQREQLDTPNAIDSLDMIRLPNGNVAIAASAIGSISYYTFDGASWTTAPVASGSTVFSLELDPSSGLPSILYSSGSTTGLKLAEFDGSSWSTETITGTTNHGNTHTNHVYTADSNPAVACTRTEGSGASQVSRLYFIERVSGNWQSQQVSTILTMEAVFPEVPHTFGAFHAAALANAPGGGFELCYSLSRQNPNGPIGEGLFSRARNAAGNWSSDLEVDITTAENPPTLKPSLAVTDSGTPYVSHRSNSQRINVAERPNSSWQITANALGSSIIQTGISDLRVREGTLGEPVLTTLSPNTATPSFKNGATWESHEIDSPVSTVRAPFDFDSEGNVLAVSVYSTGGVRQIRLAIQKLGAN